MYVSLYGTAGTEKEARDIAKKLLSKKLIACANIFPICSVFFWENKLQEDEEVGIIMKTKESLTQDVITAFKELHSYEVPCIVSWPILDGLSEYLAWIGKETDTK